MAELGAWAGGGGLALLAWLITYAVHSTLILGAAWLATRRLPVAAARLKERVWKLGLLAALCTPSLQLGLGIEPFGGRFSLAPDAEVLGSGPHAQTLPSVPEHDVTIVPAPLPPFVESAVVEESTAREARGGLQLSFSLLGLGAWLACGVLALGGLALAWLRLTARLRGRFSVNGHLLELVHDLARRGGYRRRVRLSVAPALRVPISLGWLRPEICLPSRALVELDIEEQEALLAHELAHLARRDPAWLWFMRLVSGVLCFQPLNRLARREIEDCAEILCDAWAVRHTGLRLSLASCLAQVAGWVVAERRALPAPAMARKSSRLCVRVESLLDEAHAERLERGKRALALALPLAVGFAALLVLVAPAVSSAAQRTPVASVPEESFPDVPDVNGAEEPAFVPPLASGAPASLHELRELVSALDHELDALDREFAELRAEITHDDVLHELRDSLAPLEQKLELLRARRVRLASIVGGLSAAEAEPAMAIPSTPETLP